MGVNFKSAMSWDVVLHRSTYRQKYRQMNRNHKKCNLLNKFFKSLTGTAKCKDYK